MKSRHVLVAAGLLSMVAFVQLQAAAQDPGRGTGQQSPQDVSRGQTDFPARTGAGQTNNPQGNFNNRNGQFDNRNGQYNNGQFNANRGNQYGQVSGYYSPEMYGKDRVLIHLLVPNATAQVWFEGSPTEQQGFDRLYISPPIDPNKNYTYTVKATWMENGKEVTKEQQLPVRANQQAMASFDPRFDANRNRTQEQLPLPSTSTARREETLGRPEMQEQDRNPTATGQNQNEKATKSSDLVTGKVVSVTGDRLTISEADGGNQRTFQLPNETQVTQNGQNVGHDTLKPGMQVSINLKAGSRDIAQRVEVTSSGTTDRK